MFDHPVSNGAKPEPRNIGEVYVDTLVNRGGTFERKTFLPVTFTDGYTVSTRAVAHAHVQKATVEWFRRVWPRKGELVGTWIDPETSIVWLDVVTHTPFVSVARLIGDINHEIAIWDCQRNESITL